MPDSQPPIGHDDSISSQDHAHEDSKTKTKSRRPASKDRLAQIYSYRTALTIHFCTDTAFRQQRLKAWQPILTPKSVLPLFFAIGIIFGPIGGALIFASSQVQDIVLDYTNCFQDAPVGVFETMPSKLVTEHFKSSNRTRTPPAWQRNEIDAAYRNASTGVVHATVNNTIQCTLQFDILHDLQPPVLFYYKLTNFYQNHRRYAKSFNTDQLSGKAVSASTIKGSDCTPLTVSDGKAYYPCGLAANSIFNDTFSSPLLRNPPGEATPKLYEMKNNSGIAWGSDKDLYGTYKGSWADVVPPPNWHDRYPNGYSDDYHPDLVNDEAFQVWMRLAGLPTFSKLAQRNDDNTMVAGTYTVNITHNFPVTEFGGTKSIVISTRTVVGGRNPFLGIAYVVVAGLCVVLGSLFTVTHLIRPRKLGDHTYLTWNNEAPTATTTGRDMGADAGRHDA
ncbi:CDC50 family protein [Bisporella sp. PMI_857]|nr:CDC50 family protein [Bisporella sp. PMI_857]